MGFKPLGWPDRSKGLAPIRSLWPNDLSQKASGRTAGHETPQRNGERWLFSYTIRTRLDILDVQYTHKEFVELMALGFASHSFRVWNQVLTNSIRLIAKQLSAHRRALRTRLRPRSLVEISRPRVSSAQDFLCKDSGHLIALKKGFLTISRLGAWDAAVWLINSHIQIYTNGKQQNWCLWDFVLKL